MQPIEPPDSFFCSAAQGWLELGNPAEARKELEHISTGVKSHPAVLNLRWEIHALERNWPEALHAARQLLEAAPEVPGAWLHHAYALRRVPEGGLKAAWAALCPALEKFPKDPTIPYNLACYACQLDQMDTARTLLRQALENGNRTHMLQMALADTDLEALWPEIRAW